jgi:hypothetical protein
MAKGSRVRAMESVTNNGWWFENILGMLRILEEKEGV